MERKSILFLGTRDSDDTNKNSRNLQKPYDENNSIYSWIKEVVSEKYEHSKEEIPDYVIVSESGLFSGMKYDGVRILITADHFAPDFNVFDYAIGPDQIICLDDDGKNRYFQLTEPLMEKEISEYQACVLEALKQFLFHIFDQKPEEAKRRLGVYHAGYHEKYLNEYRQLHQSVLYPIVRRIIR